MDNWKMNMRLCGENLRIYVWRCVEIFEIWLSRLPTTNLSHWRNLMACLRWWFLRVPKLHLHLRSFAARKCHQEVALLKSIAAHEVSIERLGAWSNNHRSPLGSASTTRPFCCCFSHTGATPGMGRDSSHQLSSAIISLSQASGA